MADTARATGNIRRRKTQEQSAQLPTPPTTPKKHRSSLSSVGSKSPRSPENKAWTLEQKRRIYIEHLNKWSLNHDSSSHFHGKVCLVNPELQTNSLELGCSVKCHLSEEGYVDAPKHIVVRLFAPRDQTGRYTLVVRSGAGWVPARDFLAKDYFTRQTIRRRRCLSLVDRSLKQRAENVATAPEVRDSVRIRPLFHPFSRLPRELQQYIFGLVVSKTDNFRPGRDHDVGFCEYRGPRVYLRTGEATDEFSDHPSLPKSLQVVKSQSKLTTIFTISKSLNQHMIPWIYRTTNFHFATQGFTNFMWLSGPENRKHIKQLTLSFGGYALLHCIRWLAPDPIFELFDPHVPRITPRAMQYFWRLQIQDLAKELHLSVLTIDLKDTPVDDIMFVVSILRHCFGSVQRVRFVKSEQTLKPGTEGISEDGEIETWKELCRDAFERYRNNRGHDQCFISAQRKKGSVEHLLALMKEKDSEFFDGTCNYKESDE